MTPFAMRIARALTQDPKMSTLALQVLGATCFDITPVIELVNDAAVEMNRSGLLREGDLHIDHGGLLFLPDDSAWIEWRYEAGRSGILVERTEDELGFIAFNPTGRPLLGMLQTYEDGTFVVRADSRQTAYSDADEGAGLMGMVLAASLMLINAPRGVIRETVAPHKGFQREMLKAHGKLQLRPYHVIRLDKRAGHVGGPDAGGGAPKAFHFCRAHLRRLSSGGTTIVRAHWRGDPALGICRAHYEVAA